MLILNNLNLQIQITLKDNSNLNKDKVKNNYIYNPCISNDVKYEIDFFKNNNNYCYYPLNLHNFKNKKFNFIGNFNQILCYNYFDALLNYQNPCTHKNQQNCSIIDAIKELGLYSKFKQTFVYFYF